MNKNSVKNLGEYAKTGGPGAPIGGRRKALNVLDSMLAKAENLKKFEIAIQEKFDQNPIDFFKEYVMPLMPKGFELSGPNGGPIETSNLAILKILEQYDAKDLIKIINASTSDK